MELQDVKFDGYPHIVKAQQFSREWLEEIFFPTTERMKKIFLHGGSEVLSGKRMITLFWQPSTRTRGSFQMAMSYLGGNIPFATENAEESSSTSKQESLEHTIQNWCRYRPDVIVMRHKEEGAAERAVKVSSVPIINAGDGPGQHPTQALLDVFTLQEKLGRIDGISIALVGDLKRGRTARSLAYLLSKFKDVRIFLISSQRSRMKDDIKDHLRERGVCFIEGNDIREFASRLNAVYVIRDQKEYSDDTQSSVIAPNPTDFLFIDKSVLSLLPCDSIVMHPLPIDKDVMEIRPEVENDSRVICLREQVDNGLFTRMAELEIMIVT